MGIGEGLGDGADEKMLNRQNKDDNSKKEEVKFVAGDRQNGDARIDIGNLDKTFTGMTKEELMKYAKDPFWVRLRWIFFIVFWAIWIAMLVGAILIILNAPKCAARAPLAWFKQGPLVKMKRSIAAPEDVDLAKKLNAKGVIYDLPVEYTYAVDKPEIEEKIKSLIGNYKDTDINVIFDLTTNYATENSLALNAALNKSFIYVSQPEVPTNWRSMKNGSAWTELKPGEFVLTQYGPKTYDLYMNDTDLKQLLKDSLEKMISLGVKGFRLANAKNFIIAIDLKDEVPSSIGNHIHDEYEFWTHTHSKFQEGLGDVLNEFTMHVHNVGKDEVFLSVSDDIESPEVFKTKDGLFGVDVPIYGKFSHALGLHDNKAPEAADLYKALRATMEIAKEDTWLQWATNEHILGPIDKSAYIIFLSLLPGVPIYNENFPITENSSDNVTLDLIMQLESLRKSPSYMHGDFDLYSSGGIIAYSRIKSGNPGYFVVLNPTNSSQIGNFTFMGLPEKMTFDLLSANYNGSDPSGNKIKVMSAAIPMSPYSAAILTYVPVKSG